jgi:glycosyltransferase involved in cell wall biosynthesis
MAKISAFVIAYNRADLLRVCLRRARWADELIVIDKSSTDDTPRIAQEMADHYYRVPWTPDVNIGGALEFADSVCLHEWHLRLDDDEVLSPEAGPMVRNIIQAMPDVAIVWITLRHWILGRVCEARTEYRPAMYRQGALTPASSVHGAPEMLVDKSRMIRAPDTLWIDNISHPDVASWIEKANRYTGVRERVYLGWDTPSNYDEAVELLQQVYGAIDTLKRWEEGQPDGHEAFRNFCAEIRRCG